MASMVLEAVSLALEDILAVDGDQRSAKKFNLQGDRRQEKYTMNEKTTYFEMCQYSKLKQGFFCQNFRHIFACHHSVAKEKSH